ncbi:MAG: AtpZ/AtpI family protein [Micropepsaceae bacterium]
MSSTSNGPDDKRRLDELGRRLSDLEKRAEATGTIPRKSTAEPNTALGSAFKLSTEFVAALVVGGGIGWLLDNAFGTRPALLLTLLALGVAAGFYGVFRTARRMQAEDAEKAKAAPSVATQDEDED